MYIECGMTGQSTVKKKPALYSRMAKILDEEDNLTRITHYCDFERHSIGEGKIKVGMKRYEAVRTESKCLGRRLGIFDGYRSRGKRSI